MKNKFFFLLFAICFVKIDFLESQTNINRSPVRVDTIYFAKSSGIDSFEIGSILNDLPDIWDSKFVEYKKEYTKGWIKSFQKELSNHIFSNILILTSSFFERNLTDNDSDYMGIYEIIFKNENFSKQAFKEFDKYNGYSGDFFLYLDWVYIRSKNKIFIIENPNGMKNKLLKCEVFKILNKHIKIDEFKQRLITNDESPICW